MRDLIVKIKPRKYSILFTQYTFYRQKILQANIETYQLYLFILQILPKKQGNTGRNLMSFTLSPIIQIKKRGETGRSGDIDQFEGV